MDCSPGPLRGTPESRSGGDIDRPRGAAPSSTASAGPPAPYLPPFPGYAPLSTLSASCAVIARALLDFDAGRLRDQVTRVRANGPLSAEDFRVPLDVPRRGVRSLPWRPLLLADHVVSGQVGMLEVLADLRATVLPALAPGAPLPTLVDTNIWYRTMKLVYGREAQRWDVARALARMPPLYAVWHPYKQLVHQVYLRFLPLLHYLKDGTIEVGRRWRTYPELQTLERWLAGLLLLPADRLARLRRCLDRYAAEVAWLDRRIPEAQDRVARCRDRVRALNAQVREELADAAHSGADWYWRKSTQRDLPLAEQDLADAHAELRRLHRTRALRGRDQRVLRAFADLVLQWAPACLLLGYYVRQCHWDLRTPGTAWQVREALLLSLSLLLRLDDWAERRRMTEYVRTLACAVLCWSPWHDALPACCFVEEVNEAALSRLGQLFERHPQAVTTDEAMDLYLLVQPGRSDAPRDLPPGNVGERWRQLALQRVDDLLQYVDGRPPQHYAGAASHIVTFIARLRESTKGLLAVADWPEDWAYPTPPCSPYLDAPAVEDLFRRALRGLALDAAPDAATAARLDALCPHARRPDTDVDRLRRLYDTVLGEGRRRGRRRATHRPFPFHAQFSFPHRSSLRCPAYLTTVQSRSRMQLWVACQF